MLTPYDIVRLKQRLGLTADDFVARYTLPFEMDFHGLPGLKMATKPGTRECVFRRFIQSEGFQSVFDVPEDELQRLLADEEALLIFAMRFLKQVLFGERTIAVKEGAREQRIEQRKGRIEERKQAQDRERRARMDVYKAEGGEGAGVGTGVVKGGLA
jgi:hypothetical protein